MADEQSTSKEPLVKKPLPPFAAHEKGSFGPIRLNEYVDMTDQGNGEVVTIAQLKDGSALPKGLICTSNGIFGGIPGEGTAGTYDIQFVVQNKYYYTFLETKLTITPMLEMQDPSFYANFKSQVWEALGNELPVPELKDVFERPITPIEIYYLLERFAVLTIWDVYNLDSPGKATPLNLPGMSPHFTIYDRGSCLVAAPKKLFSHARSLEDALVAARVVAREAYKRGWTIEFAGFNKMVRAAWIELQIQADKHNGKRLEILHYVPSEADIRLYQQESTTAANRPTV